ncbi:UNVERIFIED_CONTAM: hypothetical protein Scaly_2848500 [Sesamum calycinum]|uniref:Uncharacterized protein n=1 Tax=Sesamum calycinum TaxID=2727403 RepID=A0AAW2LGV7_9LAMI
MISTLLRSGPFFHHSRSNVGTRMYLPSATVAANAPAVAVKSIALKKVSPTEWTVVQRLPKNNPKHQQVAEVEQQLDTEYEEYVGETFEIEVAVEYALAHTRAKEADLALQVAQNHLKSDPGDAAVRDSLGDLRKKAVFLAEAMTHFYYQYTKIHFLKQGTEAPSSSMTWAVIDFFRSERMLRQLNHTIIALVPKSEHSPSVADYRPISCYNVIYKVITNIIADCLPPTLEHLTDSSQATFVGPKHHKQYFLGSRNGSTVLEEADFTSLYY